MKQFFSRIERQCVARSGLEPHNAPDLSDHPGLLATSQEGKVHLEILGPEELKSAAYQCISSGNTRLNGGLVSQLAKVQPERLGTRQCTIG